MKKALVIIDIQNDYFDGGANPLVRSWEASLKAKEMLEIFRTKSLPVIHVQHLSVRLDSTFFIPNTTGANIHTNVRPNAGEKIIVKNYPNSFRDTDLLDYLQSNNITDLVLCGMMTHVCVDATVRAAKDDGYNCTVISDACAAKDLTMTDVKVNTKQVQAAFLAALSYFYSEVKSTEEFLNENK
jgi:nicotinamidase-related amidase